MSDQHFEKGITGSTDHPQHRAGPDEGYSAPRADETGSGEAQSSIFDGAGNEVVVVTGTDADGNPKQGTGASAEEARASMKSTKEPIGEGFGTSGGH